MNKWHKGLLFITSNEVIWPPKNSNFMQGLKSAILAIFQKSAGLAMPYQCSPPFPPIENDRKWLYQLLPIKYELELPTEATPGLLPFRSRSEQCDQSPQVLAKMFNPEERLFFKSSVLQKCLEFTQLFLIHQVGKACTF